MKHLGKNEDANKDKKDAETGTYGQFNQWPIL